MSKLILKVEKKRLKFFLSVIAFLILIVLISTYLFKEPIEKNYIIAFGKRIYFREDVRKAESIEVFPDKISIQKAFLNPEVKRILIVFKDAGKKNNAYYTLQAIEITTKLFFLYDSLFGKVPNIKGMEIENYDNLKGNKTDLIIGLVHAIYSNQTKIVLRDNVVYLYAKNLKDMDLVHIKFLLILFEPWINKKS